MEVTEIVEDPVAGLSWCGDMEVTEIVEDPVARLSWCGETWR